MIGHAKPFEESFLTQLHEVSTILPIPLVFFRIIKKLTPLKRQLFSGWELRK